jgi:catechol 2,3-dioxygenase-like lactoylglutathione lyase family enzyme
MYPLRASIVFAGYFFKTRAYPGCMNMTLSSVWTAIGTITFLAGIASLAVGPAACAAESEFTKPVIDIGIVVKDSERTARFLTNAIGFKEVAGFSVAAGLGRRIGLIDGQETDVRVFVLEGAEPATRVKVLSFPQAPGKQADQSFIHSTLGIRYLTLYVKDMNRTLERLKQAGVRTLGETPLETGNGNWLVAVKDPDGDFIELIGPRR